MFFRFLITNLIRREAYYFKSMYFILHAIAPKKWKNIKYHHAYLHASVRA